MTGLLAVDVGNTQTALGLFEGGELTRRWRLATEPQRTGDELGLFLGGLLDLTSLEGICLASTVPALIRSYEELAPSPAPPEGWEESSKETEPSAATRRRPSSPQVASPS